MNIYGLTNRFTAFSSLRVYAISGKAYKIAAVVFALLVIGDSLILVRLFPDRLSRRFDPERFIVRIAQHRL